MTCFWVADHGEQSLHPPTSLRDFYRYIRVDFRSHHGSELYCPVSLLRVYGLTPLEEWKRDSRANRYEQLQIPAQPLSQKADAESISSTPADTAVETPSTTRTLDPPTETSFETGPTITQRSGDTVSPVPEPTSTPQGSRPDASSSSPVNAKPTPLAATHLLQLSPSAVSDSASDSSQYTLVPTLQTIEVTSSATVRSQSSPPPSQATPVVPLVSRVLIPPPQVSASGGESIYRTIMNRIVMLGLNATFHARYVEEHTVGVRELLKRLTEGVGRLEGMIR